MNDSQNVLDIFATFDDADMAVVARFAKSLEKLLAPFAIDANMFKDFSDKDEGREGDKQNAR